MSASTMWFVAGGVLRVMRRTHLAMLFDAAEGERTTAASHTHRRGHAERHGAPLRTYAWRLVMGLTRPRMPPRKPAHDSA
ncbi:hypothetical protein QZM22_10940 [Burkholderia oklahomensis]|uniref:hypothetical protein n=1 Tax=Burkholderia oklahomensis TaxID=342113 RepID=UPI002651FD92|nr:hypothetical protein [Burkholderia oklahomensis]MDN7673020.1 hypothetical protein [Burkholderia oklahomensis]